MIKTKYRILLDNKSGLFALESKPWWFPIWFCEDYYFSLEQAETACKLKKLQLPRYTLIKYL